MTIEFLKTYNLNFFNFVSPKIARKTGDPSSAHKFVILASFSLNSMNKALNSMNKVCRSSPSVCGISSILVQILYYFTKHPNLFIEIKKILLTLYGPNSFFGRFSGHNLR